MSVVLVYIQSLYFHLSKENKIEEIFILIFYVLFSLLLISLLFYNKLKGGRKGKED